MKRYQASGRCWDLKVGRTLLELGWGHSAAASSCGLQDQAGPRRSTPKPIIAYMMHDLMQPDAGWPARHVYAC